MDVESPKKSKSIISLSTSSPVHFTRLQKKKCCRLINIPSNTSLQSLLDQDIDLLEHVKHYKKKEKKREKNKKKKTPTKLKKDVTVKKKM